MEISKSRIKYYKEHPEEFKILKLVASSRGSMYDQMMINAIENENRKTNEVKTYKLKKSLQTA